MKKILGISGSLRNNSSASSVLKQVAGLFPASIDFRIYEGIAMLPHFNDSEIIPEEVTLFREELRHADGVFICTPEYAFGIPGSLKNALDWTVGSGELVEKPVALITASSVGDKGHAALLLVLSAITADIDSAHALLIPFIRAILDGDGAIKDAETATQVRTLVEGFAEKLTRQ